MKKSNKKISTKTGKKRTYAKYSYALKRKIVNEILKGILSKEEAMLRYGIRSRQSINYWISKYGLLNYRNQKNYGMKQTPQERIKELQMRVEEKREPRREFVDIEPRLYPRFDIGEPVGKRKGEFLYGRGARLADVITADANRVPFWHVFGTERHLVRDQPHRGFWRKDERLLRDVLLENIVLCRAGQVFQRHTLF